MGKHVGYGLATRPWHSWSRGPITHTVPSTISGGIRPYQRLIVGSIRPNHWPVQPHRSLSKRPYPQSKSAKQGQTVFAFVQACRLSAYALKYKTWKNHIANLRTLGVLYPLSVVEGQGADPRA